MPNIPDAPHSWCKFLADNGQVAARIFTADWWAWSMMISFHEYGTELIFHKRTAADTFTLMGCCRDGREAIEEFLEYMGIDMPGTFKQIYKDKAVAKIEGQPAPGPDESGAIIGGLWGEAFDALDSWFLDRPPFTTVENPPQPPVDSSVPPRLD